MKAMNLTGLRFGRLIAISRMGLIGGKSMWQCVCDCGNSTVVALGNLRSGSVKSCGCHRREILDKTSHGLEKHPLYCTWSGMIARCFNQKSHVYKHYGGRGISVCDRWLDIRNFIEDMGVKPKATSLDRINNEGDYEPSNCRWATRSEQQNNKRNNRVLEFEGVRKTMSEWAREFNIPIETLFSRLKKMSVSDALTHKHGMRN